MCPLSLITREGGVEKQWLTFASSPPHKKKPLKVHCTPATPQFVRLMSSICLRGREIVLG